MPNTRSSESSDTNKAERAYALKDELITVPEGIRAELAPLLKVHLDLTKKLHEAMYDNTGAIKGDFLGKHLAAMLNNRGLSMSGSQIEHSVFDPYHRLLTVQAAELDRVNFVGGHEAGDQALKQVASTLEAVTRDALRSSGSYTAEKSELADSYDIYRVRGGDFAVRLVIPKEVSDPDEFTQALIRRVKNARVSIPGVGADLLLACAGSDLHTAIDVVNSIEEVLSAQDVRTAEGVQREVIGALRYSTEFLCEVDRLKLSLTNVKRLKIEGKDYATHFQRYVKRYVGEVGDAFFDQEGEEFDQACFYLATAVAGEAFRRRAFGEEKEQAIVNLVVGEKDGINVDKPDIGAEALYSTAVEKASYKGYQSKTLGRTMIAEQRSFCDLVLAGLEAEFSEEKLNYANIRRLFSDIPGLTHEELSSLSQALKNADEKQLPDLKQGVLESCRKLFVLRGMVEELKYDSLTGLRDRSEFYSELEQKISKNEPNQVLFIDMGYLKYFNNEGGRDLGNFALQQAAELMEAAYKQIGLDPEKGGVFRYGGDEFTVIIDGTDPDKLQGFLEALEKLNLKEQPIQPTKGSSRFYFPQRLQFNYGVCDTQTAQRIQEYKLEHGFYSAEDQELLIEGTEAFDRQFYTNELAAAQVRAADIRIAHHKTSSRLAHVLFLMNNPKYVEGSAYFHQVNAIIDYSRKALGDISDESLRAVLEKCKLVSGPETLLTGQALRYIGEVAKEIYSKSESGGYGLAGYQNTAIELMVEISALTNEASNASEQNRRGIEETIQQRWRRLEEIKQKMRLASQQE